MSYRILRKFIREEIGRNYQTIDAHSYTFADFSDYNIEISGSTDRGFYLNVEYKGKKISPMSVYKNYEEARHASRMIIDKDRIKRMNS